MTFDNPNLQSRLGDILYGHKNFNKPGFGSPHYIIYLGIYENNENSFLGAMLTTSTRYSENIQMDETHFETKSETGKSWRVTYENSLIVGKQFIKSIEWAPFEKVGQLTEMGLHFVQSNVGHLFPVYYPGNIIN